jgi:hypothetical protein
MANVYLPESRHKQVGGLAVVREIDLVESRRNSGNEFLDSAWIQDRPKRTANMCLKALKQFANQITPADREVGVLHL